MAGLVRSLSRARRKPNDDGAVEEDGVQRRVPFVGDMGGFCPSSRLDIGTARRRGRRKGNCIMVVGRQGSGQKAILSTFGGWSVGIPQDRVAGFDKSLMTTVFYNCCFGQEHS